MKAESKRNRHHSILFVEGKTILPTLILEPNWIFIIFHLEGQNCDYVQLDDQLMQQGARTHRQLELRLFIISK
jgi:hypothetical protein